MLPNTARKRAMVSKRCCKSTRAARAEEGGTGGGPRTWRGAGWDRSLGDIRTLLFSELLVRSVFSGGCCRCCPRPAAAAAAAAAAAGAAAGRTVHSLPSAAAAAPPNWWCGCCCCLGRGRCRDWFGSIFKLKPDIV